MSELNLRRPFRFGVEVNAAPGAQAWRDVAREAEDLGYAVLCVTDHFGPQFAPLPALMAAADATSSLRVATTVLANDFRHPLVLAKEAATVDLLSDGRLELGIGAGWMRTDYQESGLPYDTPATRVERLEEALLVLRGLLAPGPLTFRGSHYSIDDHDSWPKPAQLSLPIMVGGGGRRVLSIAGRHADIVGINFDLRAGSFEPSTWHNGSAETTIEKIRWVRDAAGDRAQEIELNIDLLAVVTNDRRGALDALSADLHLAPDALVDLPHALVGSADDIVDTLLERRTRFGFSYVTVTEDAMRPMAPVVARLAGR